MNIATLNDLMERATEMENQLQEAGFSAEQGRVRQVIAVAEESGEFVGAARRYMGMARRTGSFEDVQMELADVVITAFITAATFDIDLPAAISTKLQIILSRGWRE